MKSNKTTDALIIMDRITGDDEELRMEIEKEYLNCKIASLIYNMRTKAGLSQQELAKLIGTKQPAIARLEDSDYGGHTFSMLQKIAYKLGYELDITMTPRQNKS